ncbi:hypothetical protein BG000_009417 [Podila horticola]|nr:hypothetical protein BG000_009417 [Podila horticola]
MFHDTFKDGRGGVSQGGFADRVRINGASGPLFCAGVATCIPLKDHGAGPDKTVGVIGIGGLGHLAIQ